LLLLLVVLVAYVAASADLSICPEPLAFSICEDSCRSNGWQLRDACGQELPFCFELFPPPALPPPRVVPKGLSAIAIVGIVIGTVVAGGGVVTVTVIFLIIPLFSA